jgi:hypothetical protein
MVDGVKAVQMRIVTFLIVVGIAWSAVAQGYAQKPSQQLDIPIAREGVSLMGVSGNNILDRCTKHSDSDQAAPAE